MDNSPTPIEPEVHEYQKDEPASIDTYILLAVLGTMMLVAIVQIVAHLKGGTWLLSLVTTLFIIAAICCVAVAARRAMATQQLIQRRSVAMSAALGSFLAGLFTVMFADSTILVAVSILMGMCLALLALCVIWLIQIIRSGEEEKPARRVEAGKVPAKTDGHGRDIRTQNTATGSGLPVAQPQPKRASQSYPEPLPVQISAMNALPPEREPQWSLPPPLPISPPRPQGALNIMPSEPSGLRSLFENDELYALPHLIMARLFIVTKSSDILENCEDACAVSPDETRFALCDGVSASKFARPWARLLALQWVAQPFVECDAETLEAWVEEPRRKWLDWVNKTWLSKINERNRSMGRMEFTQAEVKNFTTQGAAATFLGLAIDKIRSTWLAMAIGDTCLFHFFRNEGGKWECESFPLQYSSDFTDGPPSITTRPHSVPVAASHLMSKSGTYRAGDILIMATDALAMWLFTKLEQKGAENVVALLGDMEMGDNDMFVKWVNHERAKKRLTDDDTTLIIIHP